MLACLLRIITSSSSYIIFRGMSSGRISFEGSGGRVRSILSPGESL